MLHKKRARSSSLFLMELILAILFFSAASAVCMQFFVKSHLLSRNSNILNHAVNESSSIAEIIAASESITECCELLKTQYPHLQFSDSAREGGDPSGSTKIRIPFDESFLPCGSPDASYAVTLQLAQTENMLEASIQTENATDASVIIYQLDTRHHIARRTAHE